VTDRRTEAGLQAYVQGLFAEEDAVLEALRSEIERQGLPRIYISAEVGRLLQVLLRAVDARRVLEIGTLGGYSAIWMARALPPGGRLMTVELEEERAAFARDFVARAGLQEVIDIRVGDARAVLGELAAAGESYDAVFIDADKESYAEYLDRSLELVRPGGLILADNAFRGGRILGNQPDEASRGVLDYNRRAADDARLTSTIIPIRDGLAVSVVAPRG
jgi:predicted O-methyltransferase YrrM